MTARSIHSVMGTRLRSRFRPVRLAAVLAVTGFAATACPVSTGSTGPTTTIDPANNHAPVIASFAAVRPSGSSPLTTAFVWSISDVDGQSLMCTLDLNGDDVPERLVPNCSSASVRSTTYTTLGSTQATLNVFDGITWTSATTSVNVTPPSADAFNITVRLNGSMTASQQAAFTSAAARWSQAIRTGLANTSLDIPADDCGTGAPAFNGPIDDVLIDAAVTTIDGEGAILGQAGPCYIRDVGGLPLYGVMKFDVADVADLEASGDFGDVILHEMGHVLGFGTVWADKGLVGAGTSNPVFTGPTAVGAYQAISVTGPVPVENSGGPGTADSHWRESSFNGELMTGYIDHNNNPMSAVTIGAFADLGYGVDLGAADSYGVPLLQSGDRGVDVELHTQLIYPKGSR